MKNWKKWLVAGCMAALLGIGTMGTTAMAMGGGGVDRSEAVAEEEKVPSGKATQNSSASAASWTSSVVVPVRSESEIPEMQMPLEANSPSALPADLSSEILLPRSFPQRKIH